MSAPGPLRRFLALLARTLGFQLTVEADPVTVIEAALRELQASLDRFKTEVVKVLTDMHRLSAQMDGLLVEADSWEKRAAIARREGRADIVEEAGRRRLEVIEEAEALDPMLTEQKAAAQEMRDALRLHAERVERARRRVLQLKTQQHQEQARLVMQQIARQLRNGGDHLAELEAGFVDAAYLQAGADEAELAAHGRLGSDSLERAFQQLEAKAGARVGTPALGAGPAGTDLPMRRAGLLKA